MAVGALNAVVENREHRRMAIKRMDVPMPKKQLLPLFGAERETGFSFLIMVGV